MEVKSGKKITLTGLFGKYILSFTGIVILLAFFCFFVMLGTVTMIGGLLLPANYAEQVLAENGEEIRNAERVTEKLIPAGTLYGVFSEDGKLDEICPRQVRGSLLKWFENSERERGGSPCRDFL